jgi:hypothetical protein
MPHTGVPRGQGGHTVPLAHDLREAVADAEEVATEDGFDLAQARAKTVEGDDDEAAVSRAAQGRLVEDKS